jgi:DNA-binding MarR family transcriptional regulator
MSVPKRQHAVKVSNDVRTAAGEALSRVAVQIFRLEGILSAVGDRLAQPSGQTAARWRVLAAVEQEPMSVAQIARAWSLARQSVQRVADDLERDGLVVYTENPSHKRAQLVRLSPRGRTALRRIQAAQREWANGVGERLGLADLQRAERALERLEAALSEPE